MENTLRKPPWIRATAPAAPEYFAMAEILQRHSINTVCREALCPNIGECFSRSTATFMILGNVCTRRCGYCAVRSGTPAPANHDEPRRIARAVKELELNYVVITSVTRDDMEDGGAGIFVETVMQIKETSPTTKVELLIPDFKGNTTALLKVMDAHPHVLGHNVEVVKRLFMEARPQGNYHTSLELLKTAQKSCVTKSGFMIGLGESKDEILETMEELVKAADMLTIGQYLQPTKRHLPVVRYYAPEEFEEIAGIGKQMGFKHVEAGPLVRSSYHADKYGIQAS